ncbi:MAG TPA: hypothetical protein VKY92_18180 [Verrucomicrobiae bacterium]|nr:hypothetical protein [Verrucomicrobiae bacterium]
MNEFGPDPYESELRSLHPARPHPQALKHIRQELEQLRSSVDLRAKPAKRPLPQLLKWLLPASLAAAACVFALAGHEARKPAPALATSSPLKADHVEIDRQWITNFDAIANLPDGEPVRFRCEQWMDKVRVRDSSAGLVLERSTPRLEIVPVKLDIY